MAFSSGLLAGWGRTAPSRPLRVETPSSPADVGDLLAQAPPRGAIPRGLGRAYGDAAQSAGGLVIDSARLKSVSVDVAARTAAVGAGVSLAELIRQTLPLGLFPAVTPGTKHVTIGGAVSCDVHGKNHHVDGAFGAHLTEIRLVAPSGEIRLQPDSDEYWATVGGLGLTGVVVAATMRLSPVESGWMTVDTERAGDLDDAFQRFARDDEYRYSVAWIDCLAKGARLGRSVLIRGNHARLAELPGWRRRDALRPPRPARLAAPRWVPPHLVNRRTIALFNELYYRRAPEAAVGELLPLDRFFYPLDTVDGWNRLYGREGFVQYQFVVPSGAEDTIRAALERLSAARCPSFLAVLKRFGREQGLISFPMPGWTLALDIPARVPGLARLLDELDVLVAESGGRVYLAKDGRLRPELLEVMYPRLGEWREVRARLDPAGTMRSDLSRRLELVP